MKEKLLGNKKNFVILIVLLIALLAGFAFGISALISNADTDAKQEEQIKVSKEEKKALEKEKAKLEDNMEKELAEAKTQEEKEAIKAKYKKQIAKVEDKNIETAKEEKPSSSSGNNSSGTADKPSTPKKKKVWIVDQAAWDETVKTPIYSYRETWWIKFTDGTEKTYYDEAEWNNILDNATGNIASWGDGEDEEYISGYETEVIHHDEVGHWEWK